MIKRFVGAVAIGAITKNVNVKTSLQLLKNQHNDN